MKEELKTKPLSGFISADDYQKKIWRYMNLEKFEYILKDSALYFPSAEQFSNNDLHEGAITEDEYKSRVKLIERSCKSPEETTSLLKNLEKAFKPLRQYAKISCWHINEFENFAMWGYYQGQHKGIALETTIGNIIENISEYRIKPTYGIETINIGKIKYIDYHKDSMDERHGFITPFLYKRKSYEYENEVRFIISLRLAVEYGVTIPPEGINIPFNFKGGISKIILSPGADEEFKQKVTALLEKYNITTEVAFSALDEKPKY